MHAKNKSETHILSQLDDLIKDFLAIWTSLLEPPCMWSRKARKWIRFILLLWLVDLACDAHAGAPNTIRRLEGTLPCPDPLVSADAYYVWTHNDDASALTGFILDHISTSDFDHVRVESCTTAHDLFVNLRNLLSMQTMAPILRSALLMKALEIRLSYDTPLRDTLAEVRSYYRRITAMGTKIADDDIFTAILLHSMSDHRLRPSSTGCSK
ncbi:hypothetical protein V8E52_007717 [Russula decolorans]